MYKKISHTIVEEHFDHPAILPMSVTAGCNTSTMYQQAIPKAVAPVSLLQLEKDSAIAWSLLCWRLRSLVISITSGDKDIDLLESRMASDIGKIGQNLTYAYDANIVATFNRLLNNLALSLVAVITDITAGKDSIVSMAKLHSDTKAFAEFVSVNPLWPAKAVYDILVSMEDLYISQANHRIKKEWVYGVDAADRAYDLMVVKQPNNNPSFADIFAAGIFDANSKKSI